MGPTSMSPDELGIRKRIETKQDTTTEKNVPNKVFYYWDILLQ